MKLFVAFALIACASAACSEKDAKSCDADSACTWCKCAALPSQCWTLADAKKLPAGVYACDKSLEEKAEEKAPWRPPHLGDIQRYEVKYTTVGTDPFPRRDYNATYWCDKTCQKFRYQRYDLSAHGSAVALEEIDVQNKDTKWEYYRGPGAPHCNVIKSPGIISCFVLQYADAVCEEADLGTTKAYKCTKTFPPNPPAQPEKYEYIVWYAAEGNNAPLRVENSAESKTIVDGAYDIVKYSNADAFPDNLFDDPCPASVGTNKTDISCKSASGGPGGDCGATDDSCCDGPPGVGQSCYDSSTQDCCTDGPGKGHVCAKGKCSTRTGFICN